MLSDAPDTILHADRKRLVSQDRCYGLSRYERRWLRDVRQEIRRRQRAGRWAPNAETRQELGWRTHGDRRLVKYHGDKAAILEAGALALAREEEAAKEKPLLIAREDGGFRINAWCGPGGLPHLALLMRRTAQALEAGRAPAGETT